MPIVEADPWRMQYFDNVGCPDHVCIPTDDPDCYRLYPRHRWIYNKLAVCESQGLECAPHGVPPSRYPVFSKPIYNLRGMGAGGRVVHSVEEWQGEILPGHFWMPHLTGEHLSSDVAVVEGEPVWWRHTLGAALPGGIFDYWTVLAEARPVVEARAGQWLRDNLKEYSGMVNLETIGGIIIEVHLRFADQWVDLYGRGWIDGVVELYTHRRWNFTEGGRRVGYSVVLFGPHGFRYRHVESRVINDILSHPDVSSVQQTFHESKAPSAHAMPPGGFRLAIVNCWELEAGLQARERLALHHWTTQKLRGRRKRDS